MKHENETIINLNRHTMTIDRRDFITASGVAALSAAAITPSKAVAHSPATITATLENELKSAIAYATRASPSPDGAVAGADIAASVASGPLDLSPAKWLWYPATEPCRIPSSCSAVC